MKLKDLGFISSLAREKRLRQSFLSKALVVLSPGEFNHIQNPATSAGTKAVPLNTHSAPRNLVRGTSSYSANEVLPSQWKQAGNNESFTATWNSLLSTVFVTLPRTPAGNVSKNHGIALNQMNVLKIKGKKKYSPVSQCKMILFH